MAGNTRSVTGSCYCKKVSYRADRVRAEVTECHCTQCRKQSGHRYATTSAKASDVEIEGTGNITWFRASDAAERGFCTTCGSHLFWRSTSTEQMAILAATIDEPTGLHVARHIFIESKGDYYEVDDGLPRFTGYDRPHSSE